MPVARHIESLQVNSREFASLLRGMYYKRENRSIKSATLTEVIGTVTARAMYDGPEFSTHVRVAPAAESVYLDLGDPD